MILEVKNLVKKHKKRLVLKWITIQIDSPQIIALVGPNGSGKTTLMNCLMNLSPYQDGTVKILGKDPKDRSLFYEVSYLQNHRVLYDNLTGYDHLKYICHVQKLPTSRIKEVAVYVGIDGYLKKRVRHYSLKMKQHLLIAMAIINKPKLVFLDEPLNGLDPSSAKQMRNILLDLHAQGTTIIISSPNVEDIDKLTNTIWFMKDGQLLSEALEDYSANYYKMNVSNIQKATSVLSGNSFSYTVKDQTILFTESEVTLQTMIDFLNQNEIQIDKIENYKLGAERRYMELFEGEVAK